MRDFKHIVIALAAALSFAIPTRAQTPEALLAKSAADLESASAELTTERARVEKERLPLARRIADLEQQLINRRAELAKVDRLQENQLLELNRVRAEARRLSDQVKYVDSLLTEYARAFRTRLNFVEEPRYAAVLEAAGKAAASADMSTIEKFEQRSVLLNTALDRIIAAQGGDTFDGLALDRKGLVRKGKVAVVGPVALFAADPGNAAGLLQQELNKSDPTIAQMEPAMVEGCRKLVTTGSGDLLLDPTLGNAFKLSALHKGLYQQLEEGGIIMIPLLGLGVAVFLLALFKWWQFSRVPLVSERDLQQVLGHLESRDAEKALSHAKGIAGVAGDILRTAIEHSAEKKEYIEEVLYEKMLGARTRLERGLPFLALAATTGPLLGLLGTVTGMIATFRVISGFGGGDPKMLAAGISEALVCTATGMAVAIPALLFHAFLSRRAKGIIGSLEQTAVGFVNGVPEREREARTYA